MWLMHMEQTDGVQIMHCRNRLEYSLQELPSVNVDGYCPLTNTVYEFINFFGMDIRLTVPRYQHHVR